MPITLAQPIAAPVATSSDIRKYELDRDDNVVRILLAFYTADGVEMGREMFTCPLFTPQGAPRFSPQLYADNKSTLYALLLEDGHIAGTVE